MGTARDAPANPRAAVARARLCSRRCPMPRMTRLPSSRLPCPGVRDVLRPVPRSCCGRAPALCGARHCHRRFRQFRQAPAWRRLVPRPVRAVLEPGQSMPVMGGTAGIGITPAPTISCPVDRALHAHRHKKPARSFPVEAPHQEGAGTAARRGAGRRARRESPSHGEQGPCGRHDRDGGKARAALHRPVTGRRSAAGVAASAPRGGRVQPDAQG